MTYSDEEILLQLELGEDSRWEFKQIEFAGNIPKKPRRDDLADEIAAFANADGGVLMCGATDNGDVQDLSRAQMVELDSFLVEVSSDSIKPPVRIRTYHRQLSVGGRLLLVEIPRGDSQHDSPGGSFIRVGGSKQKMTSDERLRLAQRRGQARSLSFDEQTIQGTGSKTLDESLWKPLLTAEGAANPESALGKLALLADDDDGIRRATVAGVLLCTRQSRAVASQRLHHRDPLPGKGPRVRPNRCPGNHRAAEPPDRRCGGFLREEHAGCGAQGSGTCGPAPVQQKGAVRGTRQRRGASRLFDAWKQNSSFDVRRPFRRKFRENFP